ncbi:thiamine pyrophosphate-binding protein [Rhodococcus sp. USK13]|uniref:thiamine pyrophosphate-binding protein n=1 Tax=Rhodococcus sp. USK13 TaxID=2806442 RepID=UPI001BCD0F31|nr:thiamine pyrophosphate-binding protein [Rhodococcus sp. USK13]
MQGTFNDLFATALRELGVEVMFGVMGDANMYIADSFHRSPGGRFVASANESGAVLMAAGYAAVTDGLGVATVTHGAIANCVSALFDAVRGNYPVVVIAGNTSRKEGRHVQSIPQQDVVAPTGAEYRRMRAPETAAEDLAAAIRFALSYRRPVVLDIPSDFQQAECERMVMPRTLSLGVGVANPSRDSLEEAAGVIMGSNRPLVVAGRGARHAEKAVAAVAQRIGAPVATTLRGKGLFTTDPFNLGIFGMLANPVCSEVIARSDCLVVLGASLSAHSTLKGELLEGKRVVQIDDDPGSIGRYYQPDVGLIGDAEFTATMLIDLFDEVQAPISPFRSDSLAEKMSQYHQTDRRSTVDDSGDLTLTGMLHRINEMVPGRRTLSIDGGRFAMEALRVLAVENPVDFAYCLNVGHIGLSIGYGIGAAIALPEVPAVVVCGDGGFMLGGLTEFNTAVRYQADLKVFLFNDGAYGAEYYRFVNQDFDPINTTFDWPSFSEIANTLGGRGIRVTSWTDLAKVTEELDIPGPLLVEIMLDTDSIPDPGAH